MKEINFNTSKKDLAEAKIHHMLTEVMAKPQLRQRKYRYYKSLIEWTNFKNSKSNYLISQIAANNYRGKGSF